MIIIRYAEIGLKGKNRSFFENRLVANIKDCLKKNRIEFTKIIRPRGRIIVYTSGKCEELKNVFGISSFSYAQEISSYDDLKKSVSLISVPSKKSFKVDSQRVDKTYPKKSPEINAELGAIIQQNTNAKVDLKHPDIVIGLEIIENKFYLCAETIEGYCGLPLGTEGKVYVLIEDDFSLLAAWLIMKRGCAVQPIAFAKTDLKFLKKFSYGQSLELKLINDLNELDKLKCIVVSHTLHNYKKLDSDLLVLRPLIAYTDEEIKETLAELK